METGGHYVAMLTADWSYHVIFLPCSFCGEKCYGIHPLITDITSAMEQRDKYNHLFSYSAAYVSIAKRVLLYSKLCGHNSLMHAMQLLFFILGVVTPTQ